MSSEERDTILQMLADGKLTSQEAGDLLDALDTRSDDVSDDASEVDSDRRAYSWPGAGRAGDGAAWERRMSQANSRGLLIQVTEGEETRTRVHIPLGMALSAGRFIPKKAQGYLERYGLSLNEILESISRDLDKSGEIVDVNDGETRVRIIVT